MSKSPLEEILKRIGIHISINYKRSFEKNGSEAIVERIVKEISKLRKNGKLSSEGYIALVSKVLNTLPKIRISKTLPIIEESTYKESITKEQSLRYV